MPDGLREADDIAANSRPRGIRDSHLRRSALIYVRQSSEAQVKDHPGSAAFQRDLEQIPLSWGWPKQHIRLIEADQGLSAKPGTTRSGFKEMLQLINAGRVGIIIVRELSRLSRSPVEA